MHIWFSTWCNLHFKFEDVKTCVSTWSPDYTSSFHEVDQVHREALQNSGASKPLQHRGRGGASYTIKQLFEYMTVGIQLRNQKQLGFVLQTCFHLISGNFADFLSTVSKDGVNLEHNQGAALLGSGWDRQ